MIGAAWVELQREILRRRRRGYFVGPADLVAFIFLTLAGRLPADLLAGICLMLAGWLHDTE